MFIKITFGIFIMRKQKLFRIKLIGVIGLVRSLPIVPIKYFEHLTGTDGLYELRIQLGSNIYRVFCFFDEGNLIILLTGFQKKSQKTPTKEITKAMRLMKEYYEERKRK